MNYWPVATPSERGLAACHAASDGENQLTISSFSIE
jgi:hypothetical protein